MFLPRCEDENNPGIEIANTFARLERRGVRGLERQGLPENRSPKSSGLGESGSRFDKHLQIARCIGLAQQPGPAGNLLLQFGP